MVARPLVTEALHGLEVAAVPPRPGTSVGNWRFATRRRLSDLREALLVEDVSDEDSWLAARHGVVIRERGVLLTRLSTLAGEVLERTDVDALRHELQRLVADVHHHEQRVTDLAYDDVELELGGEQ